LYKRRIKYTIGVFKFAMKAYTFYAVQLEIDGLFIRFDILSSQISVLNVPFHSEVFPWRPSI